MNYKHHFHAGNFADVLKHTILVKLLADLSQSGKPFWVLDTHAGAGRYDLTAEPARRSPEYLQGIAPLYHRTDLEADQARYVQILRDYHQGGELIFYLGSPLLTVPFLTKGSTLYACELHQSEYARLHALLRKNPQVQLHQTDGYQFLAEFTPPSQQGVILIDPPFEQTNEFEWLWQAALHAHKTMPQARLCLWYPIKGAEAETFEQMITKKIPQAQIHHAHNPEGKGLQKTGVIVV